MSETTDSAGWGGRVPPDRESGLAVVLRGVERRLRALEARPLPAGGSGGRTMVTLYLPGATGSGSIDLTGPFADVLLVRYSGACRLRLARTAAGLISDAARPFTTPYLTSARRGLLYDYLALGAETDAEGPSSAATEDPEDPDATDLYYRVDGGPVDIEMVVLVG